MKSKKTILPTLAGSIFLSTLIIFTASLIEAAEIPVQSQSSAVRTTQALPTLQNSVASVPSIRSGAIFSSSPLSPAFLPEGAVTTISNDSFHYVPGESLVPLYDGKTGRVIMTGQSGTHFDVSSDGKYILSSPLLPGSGTIRLFEIIRNQSGQIVGAITRADIPNPYNTQQALFATSDDNKTIITAGGAYYNLSGQQIPAPQPQGERNLPYQVVYPTGNSTSASYGIKDIRSGKIIASFSSSQETQNLQTGTFEKKGVVDIQISPDGKTAVVASSELYGTFNLATGVHFRLREDYTLQVYSITPWGLIPSGSKILVSSFSVPAGGTPPQGSSLNSPYHISFRYHNGSYIIRVGQRGGTYFDVNFFALSGRPVWPYKITPAAGTPYGISYSTDGRVYVIDLKTYAIAYRSRIVNSNYYYYPWFNTETILALSVTKNSKGQFQVVVRKSYTGRLFNVGAVKDYRVTETVLL